MALPGRMALKCPYPGCSRVISSPKRLALHVVTHGPSFRLVDVETGDVWAYDRHGRPHRDQRWMAMVRFMAAVSDLLDIEVADPPEKT